MRWIFLVSLVLMGCPKRPSAPSVWESPPAASAPVDEIEGPSVIEEDPRVERDLLLWRVEKAGAVSWLMGTCHLPVPLDGFLPPEQESALTEARALYIEADLSNLMGMMGMMFSGGSSLREDLGASGWSHLLDRLPPEVPAPFVDRLRPWAAYGLMGTPGEGHGPGTPSVDLAVAQRAEQAGVEARFLESMEFQVDLIASMEEDLLREMAGEAPRDGDPIDNARLAAAACNDGDLAGLEELLEGAGNDPTIEKLFGARNRAWMEILSPELEAGEVFVAVGVGHMPGPDGLLDLAERQGFEVQRVRGMVPPYRAWSEQEVEAQERDPSRIAMWREALSPLVEAVCVPGNQIHDCFTDGQAHCTERLDADLALCLEQYAPHLPESVGVPDSAMVSQIVGCGSTGLIADAIATEREMQGATCEQTMDVIRKGVDMFTSTTQ